MTLRVPSSGNSSGSAWRRVSIDSCHEGSVVRNSSAMAASPSGQPLGLHLDVGGQRGPVVAEPDAQEAVVKDGVDLGDAIGLGDPALDEVHEPVVEVEHAIGAELRPSTR